MDDDSLGINEIQRLQSIIGSLSKIRKKEFTKQAKCIEKIIKNLPDRQLVQSMAGSAAKAFSKKNNKDRSFDILQIEKKSDHYEVTVYCYEWNSDPGNDTFNPPYTKYAGKSPFLCRRV